MSSRLNGRVTYPGSSDAQRFEMQDSRRGDRSGQYRSQEESKPRRNGPVRYQGTYSDRFRQQENQENQAPQRAQDYLERRVPFQGSELVGRSQDFNRHHQSNDRVNKSERFETSPRAERSPAEFRKPVEDVNTSEEILNVENFIALICDTKNERSASQIKRTILGSTYLLDTMKESDWKKVCKAMIATALDQGEPQYIADLITTLFQNNVFSAVMSEELCAVSSTHIMEENGQPCPAFLAAILCAHWPRQYAKAIDNINQILFTSVSIVHGWIDVVSNDTKRFIKKKSEDKEKVIEEPFMVNKCAVALSDLCDAAQRQLSVKWPELTDEINQCIKPAILYNKTISGDNKERLLDTLMSIKSWMKSRQVKTVSTGC